jgi:hydroxyisourate hydrolase
MPAVGTAGQLTTHVLDIARGRPAAGVAVTLVRLVPGEAEQALASAVTNADGRTDEPLLAALDIATYELRFAVADYFAAGGHAVGDPPFLDVIPVRFAISEPGTSHHVPLLVAPWAYSTYRGS